MLSVKKIGQLTGHNSSIYTLTGGNSPSVVLSGSGDGRVIAWNLTEHNHAKMIARVETQIFSLYFIKSHNYLVIGNMNGGVHWIDLNKGKDLLNVQHHNKGVFDIQLIDNEIYTIGGGGKITRWSIENQRPIESTLIADKSLRSLNYSIEKDELVIGASDNSIYFLDKTNFTLNHQIIDAHNNSVFSVKYIPNTSYLLSGGRDALLKVWDLSTRPRHFLESLTKENSTKCISEQPAHWYTINHIAIHPKFPIFATASRDRTIKLWDLKTFKLLKVIDTIKYGGHTNSVNKLYWSAHNEWLVSCSDDRTLMIWEIDIEVV